MFNRKWFIRHQDILLWFANTFIGRYILRISGKYSSVGKRKIVKIEPHAITWLEGVKIAHSQNYKKIKAIPVYSTEFRTHNKFSKRLFYAFYPLWYLIHLWDTLFANNFQPAWNLGFDTLTVYPDAHTETTSVDGVVLVQDATSWASARDGSTGSLFAQDTEATNQFVRSFKNSASNWHLTRAVLLFDTSALPASPTISSAVLSIKDTSADARNADTDTVDIVASTPASNTALATGDYNSFGTTSFGAIAFASWNSAGTYNDFTLNASGIAAISDSGVTKFGARSRRDINNSEPTGDNLLQAVYADTAGTTSDPKLVVTYTVTEAGTVGWRTLLGVGQG